MTDPRAPLPEQAIRDEVRIVQAVQTLRSLPVLVFGNAIAALAVASARWDATISSHAVYPLAVLAVLLLPMVRSYLALRGRPRPERVSARHIRATEIHSLLLALAWVATLFLLLRDLGFAQRAFVLMAALVLAFGSAAMLPSLPRASLAYSVPMLAASAITAWLHDVLAVVPLLMLYVGASVSLGITVRNNWRTTLESVRLDLRIQQQNVTLASVSSQLAKYISPQLYRGIFTGEQRVEIVSKRKKLTVFFSDIVNFTETTDRLEPEELTEILNRYLTEMATIAEEYGANFDKFIGDSIVLYFGDPETDGVKEDAAACVRMAIAMQQRMVELQGEWRQRGLERPFEVRIGINTGYCTVGNFGSEDRMDYTIIGREVNLASRLESFAEEGGILLSHATYSLVRDWVMAEQAQSIAVKGFARPITTYRVTGIYDDAADNGRVVRLDREGLRLIIDHDRLGGADREQARRALEAALDELGD